MSFSLKSYGQCAKRESAGRVGAIRDFQELEFQTLAQVESGSLFILRREGRSSAAGPGGVGIAEFETAAIKAAGIVDDRAGEIRRAGAININFDTVHL
jgi:hypothetical protein